MAREDLQITITAVDKASGVFKGIANTVGSVDKGVQKLNETARNLNWMFLGQDLLRAARVGATGLESLVKASSDVVEAQNFVEQVFGDTAKGIEDYAKTATTSTLMSQKAILDAAATFGVFGASAGLAGQDLNGFSTNLIQLAADMASVKNTTVDQAINAIGAAFRNEFTPIRQYGAALDEATVKAKALELGIYSGTGSLNAQQRIIAVNQLLYEQLGFAIGDVGRTFDTFANQQRLLSAQFENFKASIGSALMPAFQGIMNVAEGAMNVFQSLPTPVQNLAVRAAAAGTALLGLAGGIVYVAGKGAQALKAFTDLRSSISEIMREGSGLQKTFTGIGLGIGAIGATLAGVELIGSTFNDITNVAGKTADSINDINIALAKVDSAAAIAAFQKLAKTENDAFKLSGLWEDWGKSLQVGLNGPKVSIENLDDAFHKLLETSGPAAAANMLDALQKSTEGMDKNSRAYKDTIQIIQRYTPEVQRATQAAQAQGNETGLTSDQIKKYGSDTLAAKEATKAMSKEQEDAAKQTKDWADALVTVQTTIESLSNRTEDFGNAVDQSLGKTDWIDNIIKGKDAVQDLIDNLKDSDAAVRSGAQALDLNTASGRDNLKTVNELRDTIGKDLVRSFQDSGGSIEAARQNMNGWRDSVVQQMKQAGISQPVIEKYVQALGLTDGTFEAIIKLSGQEEARRKLDELHIDMTKIPATIYTEVQAAIDAGDYERAYDIMKKFLSRGIETPVTSKNDDAFYTKKGMENVFNKPLTQTVETENTDKWYTKKGMEALFGAAITQTVTTDNKDKWYTKAGMQALFGASILQPVNTANNDAGSTKAGINYHFSSPIWQNINTSNSDAGATKSRIASQFATPITQYVRIVFPNAVGVPPGAAAIPGSSMMPQGQAARPTSSAVGVAPAAASYATYLPAPVTAGLAAPVSTPSVINLSVNMPTGTNETRVVDLLRSYARSNGRRTFIDR